MKISFALIAILAVVVSGAPKPKTTYRTSSLFANGGGSLVASSNCCGAGEDSTCNNIDFYVSATLNRGFDMYYVKYNTCDYSYVEDCYAFGNGGSFSFMANLKTGASLSVTDAPLDCYSYDEFGNPTVRPSKTVSLDATWITTAVTRSRSGFTSSEPGYKYSSKSNSQIATTDFELVLEIDGVATDIDTTNSAITQSRETSVCVGFGCA